MQVLCARDPRFGIGHASSVSTGALATATVHSAAVTARAATPVITPGCQTNRQTSPAFMKAQSARVLSTGTPNYHSQVIARTCQLSTPQLPQAQYKSPEPAAPPPPPAEPLDSKFGMQGPAPLPMKWNDEFEVATEAPILGGGAFAEVFKVRHRQSQQHFAVKVMHRPNFTLRGIERQIEMEIRAMVLAAREADETGAENHIVRLIDYVEEGEYVFLMLELCEQGDILRKLHQTPTLRFPEALAVVWTRQLLQGLATLHGLGIIHRDIKPDNLLCTEQGVLKIADFGWCAEASEAPRPLAGTFQYMAPEVLQNEPQTVKADVWSAGVTLYQMLVGKPLLNTYLGPGATNISERNPHEATAIKQRWLLEEMRSTCPPSPDLCPQDLSPLCWDFLRRLLVPEVNARATVAEALQHPWFEGPDLTSSPSPEAGSVSISRSGSTGAGLAVGSIQEAQESDDDFEKVESPQDPERVGAEAYPLSCTAPAKALTILTSPAKVGKVIDPRSPISDRTDHTTESIDNVPTPLNPRNWDPSRNMAYSPPVKKSDPERLISDSPVASQAASEDGRQSPERSPETRLRFASDMDAADSDRMNSVVIAAAPPDSPRGCRLQTTPGRDLETTPRQQMLPPPAPAQQPGSIAAAAMKAAGIDPNLSVRAVSPVQGRLTPLPPSNNAVPSPIPSTVHKALETVPLVSAPYPRLSPLGAGGRSMSPSGTTRTRGTSLGSPLRYTAGRRPVGLGGAPPTVSAPRLRLSAPGDLISGSVPAGVLSTGAIPQLTGSAGPCTSSPHRRGMGGRIGVDSASSWRVRTRPEVPVDPHTLLTELHNTNENLRMAFVQLVNNMSKPVVAASSLTMPANNFERVVKEDVALTAAVLEPFLPGHGAASAPVASPLLTSTEAPDDNIQTQTFEVVDTMQDELTGTLLDILSATAPPHLVGTSTPGVLAPMPTSRDGMPQQRAGLGAGRRVVHDMGLATARDRENMAPANQVLAGGKQTCVSKPRQAGSVQVRQGSMSRYGASKVDMLSQTASAVVSNVQHATSASTVRECRTPIMPIWPRAASPERCMASRCTLQPQAIQLVPGSTQLPPPRLAASQPRSVKTPAPAHQHHQQQHVWAYQAGGPAMYRACDDRRRASVPGGGYYTRPTA